MTPTPPHTRSNNKGQPSSSLVKVPGITTKQDEDRLNIQKVMKNSNLVMAQNNEILKKLTDLEAAVQFLSSKYDDLKLLYDKVAADNASLIQNNLNVTTKCQQLQQNNMQLNKTLNEIKQNELKKNLVIFGIPGVKDHHSLQVTFNNILDKLDIPSSSVELDDIFQKKPMPNDEQSPIFVKFRTLQTKIDFKQAVKNTTKTNKQFLYASDIGFTRKNKIIFADQLTDDIRNLLREAKQLIGHGYKYVWTVNGKVLVRRNEGTKVILVKTQSCIDELKSHNITI